MILSRPSCLPARAFFLSFSSYFSLPSPLITSYIATQLSLDFSTRFPQHWTSLLECRNNIPSLSSSLRLITHSHPHTHTGELKKRWNRKIEIVLASTKFDHGYRGQPDENSAKRKWFGDDKRETLYVSLVRLHLLLVLIYDDDDSLLYFPNVVLVLEIELWTLSRNRIHFSITILMMAVSLFSWRLIGFVFIR